MQQERRVERSRSRRVRRRAVHAAALVALVAVTTGCMGTWGLRSSYRSYVTAPFADGSLSVDEGVTWTDGPGTGKGPFQWPIDTATFDPGTEQGAVQFRGAVRTKAHPVAGGHALELSIWNPRLVIDGDSGTLHADINHRPYAGTNPTTLPPLQASFDVPFATVDLSGATWVADANGNYEIKNAPMVGIESAMALIGWDTFYGNPVALDPLSVTFNPALAVPALAASPRIVVSQTTGLRAGDTISVWGTGFDPAAHTGTRPPLSGLPSGAYVVFGKFADTWQPSAGAPSSARTVINQKWALPAASRQVLDPSGTGASFATIDQYGRFEVTLTVGEHANSGNYGVYTFAGSGAVNAGQELAVPVALAPAA